MRQVWGPRCPSCMPSPTHNPAGQPDTVACQSPVRMASGLHDSSLGCGLFHVSPGAAATRCRDPAPLPRAAVLTDTLHKAIVF